jgi:hypothetical protein
MKKFLLFLLAFNYLMISSGVALNTHYCMGEVASVDLFDHGSDECGKCGMKNNKSNGCCKDEVSFVKIEDSHNFATTTSPVAKFAAILPIRFSAPDLLIEASILDKNEPTQSPPESNLPARSILHCVFRC